ncbi:glucosyltransferase domain-containing protein [Salinicola rhizosphaerae]|uniref:Glycosyltransferase RgtA/B/C/D-like domain-containing protein n=1 Tax=Salinicola rhizosphaerae TaxID=1443141 RepID=A0ABQ3E7W0_9GAMM|nr:glucosyltransferase domain-containing protein [Salinicola rhizosphaerae]GHB27799.1 hypothetical protein GCM10009038_28120 [Salinicola rhizosphaerae]
MRSDSFPLQTKMTPRLRRWLGIMAYLVLFSYPLIQADRLYRDDIWRSFHGEMGWVSNGRPLASFVMACLNGGPRLADLAPLPLWLGLATLAAAILAWRERLKEFDPGTAWLAMLILVIQPFFLQNLSYHFDALPMALSLAGAILAAAWALHPRPDCCWQARFRWLCGGGALLASLLLYQPAANVFFVLLAWHALLTIAQFGRPDWARHGTAFAIGVLALFIAKLVADWLVRGSYSVAHAAMVPWAQLPSHLVEQNWRFWRYAMRQLDTPIFWLFLGCAGVGTVLLIVETARHRRWPALIPLLVVMACLPLGGLGFIGALADPIWRPRIMIGFGALYAGSLFCVLRGLQQIHGLQRPAVPQRVRERRRIRWPGGNAIWLSRGITLLALATPLTLSFAYGNAQRQQSLFADHVASTLIDDLTTQPEARPLVIDGTLPYTRTTRNAIAVHPIVGELIFPYLSGDYWWGYQDLYRRGLPATFAFTDDMGLRHRFEAHCLSLPPLSRRAWYTLYRFESHYVVALDGDCHRALTATELPVDD